MHEAAALIGGISGLWLLGWAIFAAWRIVNGDNRPMLYLILVQFVFAGAPMLMDVVVGPPSYSIFPGLRRATSNDLVSVVYALYMAACPPVWWLLGGTCRSDSHPAWPARFVKHDSFTGWALHLAVLSPLVAVALSPVPSVYLTYGLAIRDSTSAEIRAYQSFVSAGTLIAGLAAMCLLTREKSTWVTRMYALAGCMGAMWLNGKRHIVAMMVTWALASICRRTGWRRGTRATLAATGVAVIAGFCAVYQFYLRPMDSTQAGYLYDGYRVDFGRDHGIKLALEKELEPSERPLLEFRGQSVLFALTFWVPRSMWPEKPYPYYVYFTGAVLDVPTRYSWIGWGVTNCWLDEAVANFGLWGMLLGVLLPGAVCRYGGRGSPESWLTTVTIAYCLMTSDVAGWTPILLMGIFFYAINRFRQARVTSVLHGDRLQPVPAGYRPEAQWNS